MVIYLFVPMQILPKKVLILQVEINYKAIVERVFRGYSFKRLFIIIFQ